VAVVALSSSLIVALRFPFSLEGEPQEGAFPNGGLEKQKTIGVKGDITT
jgi:hypothetical protein